MGRIIPYIVENKIHVWNHQPDIYPSKKFWFSIVSFPIKNDHHSRNRDIFSKQMQQQRP